MSTEIGFASKTRMLLAKDVRTEVRARDTLPPMIAFALVVTLLLGFTLGGSASIARPVDLPFGTVALADVTAGFFWIVVLFAGLIGAARTFEIERELGALDSLLLVPLDRSGLFASKAVTNLLAVVAVQVLVLPLFALLFGLALGTRWWVLAGVVLLVDVGFAAVATLFAALAAQTRSRELMLPVLALPTLVPLFIGAVELTSDLFTGGGLEAVAARGWFAIIVAFDLIFSAVGALAFDLALE